MFLKWILRCSAVILLITVMSDIAVAQETEAQAMRQSFTTQLFFWSTAFALLAFIARFIFREQLSERRTIRRLTPEIGPNFREFEIPTITHWVNLCAPHVWSGWTGGSLREIDDFATPAFLNDPKNRGEQDPTRVVQASLVSVVKVHPIVLLKGESTPPPEGIELILRVEQRGIYCVKNREGKTLDGSEKVRSVQHFWTLIHQSGSWRLHRVWPAEDDFKDFPTDREVPPISEWPDI